MITGNTFDGAGDVRNIIRAKQEIQKFVWIAIEVMEQNIGKKN